MIFEQAYSLTDALLCISTYQFAFSHMSFVFANMSYINHNTLSVVFKPYESAFLNQLQDESESELF